jgi:hypothetical protein
MYGDMRVGAVVAAQHILHLGGFVVGLAQGEVAVHEQMELDGIVVADAACV